MNCIIIDDEPLARAEMRSLIKEASTIEILGDFSNALTALEFLKTNDIDLIFLELEPLFFLSKSNGLVYTNWRFNTSVISTEQMKQIADDFSNTFNECSKTICEENIMIDEKV